LLARADLTGASFHHADLSNADLTSATLTGTDLRSADLSRTRLRDATLTRIKLDLAKTRNADLTGAIASEGTHIPGGWKRDPVSSRLKRSTPHNPGHS
jgi:uncharacterized protein YjbI with pentapeptide repeats